MLCIVVVPGDIIKIQEREHFVVILLQAANELLCRFAGDQVIGETIKNGGQNADVFLGSVSLGHAGPLFPPSALAIRRNH